MELVVVRPVEARDVDRLHEINEAAVPGVGSVSRQDFTRLVFDQADVVLVATQDERLLGFVLCMLEGIDYGSLNYAWISENYVTFAYVESET